MAEHETRQEINRLYWGSEIPVAEIADRLDISRRALYDGIDPRPAGRPCPQCGTPLGYRNRTAMEEGEAECPECGRTTVLAGVAAEEPEVEQQREAAALSPTRRVPPSTTGPATGLALLAGLAVGAVAAYVLHRR
ncbi:MAG: hypothetical protein ACLFRX_04490 [Gemmatimonadota bacterium]